MILLFSGLPGSGKSFSAIRYVIVPNLEKGRRIVTNIPLRIDEIRKDIQSGEIITLENSEVKSKDLLIDYPGSVFVLDEVSEFWPAGLLQKNFSEIHNRFFTQHRHSVGPDDRSAEIVLLTQDASQIAKPIRVLIDKTYYTEKRDALGASGHYRVKIFQGSFQIGQRVDSISGDSGKYEEPFTRYYISHMANTHNDSVTSVKEEKPDQRATIWKSWSIRFAAMGLIAAFFAVVALFNSSIFEADTPSEVASQVPLAPEPKRSDPHPKKLDLSMVSIWDLPESDRYRIEGYLESPQKTIVSVKDSSTGYSFSLDGKFCKQRSNFPGEMACRYKNTLVAFYTGPRNPSLPNQYARFSVSQ